MERGLKVVILAIVSFCLMGAQPSLAKEPHGHRTRHASGRDAPTRHGGTIKGASSIATSPNDTIDVGVTVASPPPGSTPDKDRDLKPSLMMTKPKNFQVHSVGVPGPSNPVARNALGQPVSPVLGTTDSAKHFGPKLQTPDAVSSVSRAGVAGEALGEANVGSHNTGPLANVRIPSSSKIGGAGLIHSSLATSRLGGPAKPFAGIDGTTLRPKH
jgi:hypothetical protein